MPFLSDIPLQCSKCNASVIVTSIEAHHRHHKALQILKFKQGRGHITLDILLKRRRAIIKKFTSRFKDNPKDPDLLRRIDRVNESFDIVRFELLRGKSICHFLVPYIGRVSAQEGGLGIESNEVLADIQSDLATSTADKSLPECIQAIGICHAMNVEYKNVMEDRTVVQCDFMSLTNSDQTPSCYVGIFDGYCGSTAADHCCQSLHGILQKELEKENTGQQLKRKPNLPKSNEQETDKILQQLETGHFLQEDDDDNIFNFHKPSALSNHKIAKCFQNTYQTMDEHLAWGVGESSWVRWSGCSAATCVILNEISAENNKSSSAGAGDQMIPPTLNEPHLTGRIFMANAGDVQGYLYHKSKPYPLTRCHTLRNDEESKRVREAGGAVMGSDLNLTINGVLSTSRGLGNHGDPALRRCVINRPYTTTAKIDKKSHFLVIATSSVWSTLDPEEIYSILNNIPKVMPVGRRNILSSLDGNTTDGFESVTEDNFLTEPKQCKLTSIVETEEESAIEEVVIVHRRQEEYTDDEEEESISNDASDQTSLYGFVHGGDGDYVEKGETYKTQLAEIMSQQIVRAALAGGAKQNVSVAVVLFKGYFE
ncbi:unnamed protein product [Clavelina lepadiformis]|uniref:PPM-type phosphatase domain-containing protein n=1 Tax=Clavelina lepadiformis TaxID=159417 RepID=A0ABP0GN78_CLALP